MLDHRFIKGFLLAGLALLVCGCNSPSLVSIAITPTTQVFTLTPGLQVQFTAIGTFDQGNHPKTTQDVTDEVTWTSNTPGIATINSTGLVTTTGTNYGTSIITASMNGFTGLVRATATVGVCPPGDTVSAGACVAPSSAIKGAIK